MEDDDAVARAIYQDLLEKINGAILADDAPLYAFYIDLPHEMETFEGRTVIEDTTALDVIFRAMVQKLRTLNVSGLDRFCSSARFIDNKTIHGCHETRLITKDLSIINSYPALSTLRLTNGQWRVKNSQYATKEVPVSLTRTQNEEPS